MVELKNKGVNYGGLEAFADEMEKKYTQKESIPVKVSELENDAGYQTGEQVSAAINAKVSSTYHAGGSVAFADLPELTEANLGLVVNVTSRFTTTEDFVEGAGQKHPAGTNVVVALSGEEYKYDVLAGFVDLSGLAEKEQVAADIETARNAAVQEAADAVDEKLTGYVKTEDIEAATEAEIRAIFSK